MSYDYDPEAIYQEADILQAEYEAEARRYAALEAQGICTHGSWLGRGDGNGPLPGGLYYPEQEDLQGTEVRCTAGCGQVFASDEEIHAEHAGFGS